ncbi:uncharacterized protein [Nicotiana sylvestris]|uniref:uncharacterized protein n=1 Tax=Nicotiana sylvestris TaxID=4096 RepID=UPI00388C3B65
MSLPLEYEAPSSTKVPRPIEVDFGVPKAPVSFEVAVLPPRAPIPVAMSDITPSHSNAIPWDYTAEARRKGKTKTGEAIAAQGITRIGRVYTPEHLAESRNPGRTIETGTDDLGKKIQDNEYSVVEQLNKIPAQIFILALMQRSDAHKNALMKILSEAYVPSNITGGEMANMSLHEIKDGAINVKAFDGSQRSTIGEISLCLQMGPTWFDIDFQVIDVPASYNLLLGRPWIHTAGAVASTLHQAVKFEWNHQEVIIHGNGSNPIYSRQTVPMVGGRRKKGGETYHHIERVNAVDKDKWWDNKIESILNWYGYEPGKGLGKNLQGITKPIKLKEHGTTFGLGYEYTWRSSITCHHHGATFQPTDIIYGSEEDEALAAMKNLFLEDDDMDCCVIFEEEGPSIQAVNRGERLSNCITITCLDDKPTIVTSNETTQQTDMDSEEDDIPKEVIREVENFENRPKSNLDKTENAATKWTDDCQKAFDKIKEYLSTPPVLVPPKPGRPRLLYLAVLEGAFGCVLGQHDETGRKEQAIYYLNTNFIDPIPIKIHDQPAYCAHVEEEADGKPWFHDIKERTPNLGLLRCVEANEASKLLDEVHAGTCGPHMNGFVLAKKILRQDIFG